jgi:hypothetical protein
MRLMKIPIKIHIIPLCGKFNSSSHLISIKKTHSQDCEWVFNCQFDKLNST